MPTKIQHKMPAETARTRGRTNTMTTTTSKTTVNTVERTVVGQPRINSGTTRSNSASTTIIVTNNSLDPQPFSSIKVIHEVDDTNIDEVLSLDDLSSIPKAFITEIKADKVYETILEELQKKLARQVPPKKFLVSENQSQKVFSPRLFAINDDDDNDDVSIADEDSSTTSTEQNECPLQSHDEYDTDIESEPVMVNTPDITGRHQYRELCEKANTIPCSYFIAHIEDTELILRYHQFSTDDIRSITKTLASNLNVERLYLDGNYLQQQSTKYISQMIVANDCITELSLTDNRLGGGKGTKDLCQMIILTRHLKKINLSGNKFNELDVTQLIEAFEQNKILRELDLSHNSFGEACGKALGAFISSNDSLESIDLSWNNFRGRSAIELGAGIKENVRLKRCNLEMNGFGPEGGKVLAECVKQNGALELFNINANRLNTPTAFAIAEALLSNDSLQILKIGDNQINSDGVLAVFLCTKINESSKLQEIDFSHTVVTSETVTVCEELVKLRNGNFRYTIGSVTNEKLQPNSTSECYVKTDEEALNRLRSKAASVKPNTE